jgi:Tfp pilus tip-associated adhesin PilY1
MAANAMAVTPLAGEEALFTSTMSPDALIVLDLSGSMLWTPAGATMYIDPAQSCENDNVPHYATSSGTITKVCTIDPYGTVPRFSTDAACTGPFYTNSTTGHAVNCRRVMIAQRALFDLLDDNDDNKINSDDEGDLAVRIGYMRFKDGNDTAGSYTSGNNQLIRAIDSKYSLIYCGRSQSCEPTSTSGGASIINDWPNSGTPLASSLNEAKLYLDAHKTQDSSKACRKKFVILISDGADTYACSGSGSESQADQYKRRRESVAKAKALADAGYKVFVIGFGDNMPDNLENTLNWMAYYGGTDNPSQTNSGDSAAYNPAAVTSCADATTDAEGYATANDPGNTSLSGYAFIAADASQLASALKTAMTFIRQANYSFSQSSVQSTRTADENFLYEGSFEPSDTDPFWRGHLKKYEINSNGTVGSVIWDAGEVLRDTDSTARTNIKTYKSTGGLVEFTTSALTPAMLGVTTDAQRNAIVGYVRGEAAFNADKTIINGETKVYKLGDVFRSTPITVGTPSAFYEDGRDINSQFTNHRSSHQRLSALGNRLIVAGANAGQFHAFKTSDGTEAWSFVPPNLLTKLKNLAHATHPPAYTHQYFVDGPVTVADVWWGTGDGTAKAAGSWKTILVFGEGRGVDGGYAWSSSAACDTGISATYSETYKYYCGYYAFNLNDSLNPSYLWTLKFSDSAAQALQAPYLGDPWSKMMVGRVRINVGGTDTEKWVGFIGGGYNKNRTVCTGGGGCDRRGKGFFVVDLEDGEILWSFTYADDTSNMTYSIPAPPAIVDTDNDSFVDTAYIGDLGGNMWRFKFCRAADMPYCAISGQTTNWSGNMLYDSSTGTIRPIYTSPAAAKDTNGNIWVYWGTGDKTDPTASNAQEQFYAVKDTDRTSTYRLNDIENITAAEKYYDDDTKAGYRILMNGQGEKMLADPAIFGGVVYFTTYTPVQGNDPCEQAGEATLYAVEYTTGTGALTDAARSMSLGLGIPSAPVLSLKPGTGTVPDLYVTTSGGGGTSASTQRVDINPRGGANRTNMLYWKDTRVR